MAVLPSAEPGAAGRRLRVLSYNIQTGVGSGRYRHYLTRGWRHFLPYAGRQSLLDRIAHSLAGFDLVGLQEVDAGSLRTGFVNLVQYLARQAQFPFWYGQETRRIGTLARHGNGLLARLPAQDLVEHRLPGLPGRGALLARFGHRDEPLGVFILHLALGPRARHRQLDYLAAEVNSFPHAIVMGDFNCHLESRELQMLLQRTGLRPPEQRLSTFPSWRPRHPLDHILVTPSIRVDRAFVPPWPFSDHRPIAMELAVPDGVHL